MTDFHIHRIPNIQNYTMTIEGDVLILTPKEEYNSDMITVSDLNETNLQASKIISCIVKKSEEVVSKNRKKYSPILKEIWKSMSTSKILQNTTFNMKPVKDETCGYKWYPDLGLSIQNKDANGTMKEILNMVKLCNYSIEISVKLKNGERICYKHNI